MSQEKPHGIEKAEFSKYGVTMTLENGVTVRLAANSGYLHLSFSGIGSEKGLVATGMSHPGMEPKHDLELANNVNIYYPTRDDDQ